MKKIKLIGVLFIFFLTGCSTNYTDLIRETDTYVNDIENELSSATTCNKDIFGKTTEGGHVIAYFDKNLNLVKLFFEFFGEMGKVKEDVYIKNGIVVFEQNNLIQYDMPFYIEGYKEKTPVISKYYFENGALTYWLEGGRQISSRSKDFETKKSNLHDELANLDLNSKNNNSYCTTNQEE